MAATRLVVVESEIDCGTFAKLKPFLYDAMSLSLSLVPGELRDD